MVRRAARGLLSIRRPPVVLVALLLAVLPWSVPAGAGAGRTGSERAADAQVLPGGPPRFATDELVWAKGSRIHLGPTDLRVDGCRISWMLRTPHGFFLELGRRHGGASRIGWYAGEAVTWLRRDAARPSVSPDGRLAGWVDRGGPRLEDGRSGRVQVVDLATGRRVWSTTEGMDGNSDVDEEAFGAFEGFDDEYAYWLRAEGEQRRRRVHLASGQVSYASTLTEDGLEVPVGLPYDSLSGRPVTLVDGRPGSGAVGGAGGFLSPDGRFAFDLGTTARLRVTDASTGRRIDPDWGGRFRAFAGWRDSDTFYAALPQRCPHVHDPRRGDGVRGRFAACDLPSGACTRVARFRDVHRIVVAWGGGFEAS